MPGRNVITANVVGRLPGYAVLVGHGGNDRVGLACHRIGSALAALITQRSMTRYSRRNMRCRLTIHIVELFFRCLATTFGQEEFMQLRFEDLVTLAGQSLQTRTVKQCDQTTRGAEQL